MIMTAGEFFGTLQDSVTKEWREHLKTNKYSAHMALDEFYKEMPEKIDALIEAWQADNDIVNDYKNVLEDGLDAIQFLQTLKEHVKTGRSELFKGQSELESLADDILSQIDSTLYKLKHLTESRTSLSEYVQIFENKELSLNELKPVFDLITNVIANSNSKDDKPSQMIAKAKTTGFKTYKNEPRLMLKQDEHYEWRRPGLWEDLEFMKQFKYEIIGIFYDGNFININSYELYEELYNKVKEYYKKHDLK